MQSDYNDNYKASVVDIMDSYSSFQAYARSLVEKIGDDYCRSLMRLEKTSRFKKTAATIFLSYSSSFTRYRNLRIAFRSFLRQVDTFTKPGDTYDRPVNDLFFRWSTYGQHPISHKDFSFLYLAYYPSVARLAFTRLLNKNRKDFTSETLDKFYWIAKSGIQNKVDGERLMLLMLIFEGEEFMDEETMKAYKDLPNSYLFEMLPTLEN